MYFAELTVLLFCCSIISGLRLLGRRHGFNFRFQEINHNNNNNIVLLSGSSVTQTKWIQQPLDHFDDSEKRTWKMKYFQRLDMWEPNGPIYLFLNGEGKADYYFSQAGITYELARETKGAIFLSEHRYYGDSKPFKNYTTDNLTFLSSIQALADNARLITQIKLNPQFHSSKVVVIGGSYAGSLAAWMKLLYPDLVDAVIASSGPVLAKTDFFEYLETVSDDFKKYGTPECINKISNKFRRYEELLKTNDGIKLLKKEENICNGTDMNKIENQQFFFLEKVAPFAEAAQYGNVNIIKTTCKNVINSLHVFTLKDDGNTWSVEKNCFNYDFNSMIEHEKQTANFDIPWTYQTCTEFGYFVTSNSTNNAFAFNVPKEYYFKMCTSLFGPSFNEARVNAGVLKTNQMYGGLKPNVTKVVFSNGELDPWHRLSILKNLSPDAPAIVIPFSSHCEDLHPDMSDNPKLGEARKYIKHLIKNWIGVKDFGKTKQ